MSKSVARKAKDALRILTLRQSARRLYLAIYRRADGMDCGARLADFIAPNIPRMERAFDAVMQELATIDPEAKRLLASEKSVARRKR